MNNGLISVCVLVRVCVRACVHACVRACVRMCVCVWNKDSKESKLVGRPHGMAQLYA